MSVERLLYNLYAVYGGVYGETMKEAGDRYMCMCVHACVLVCVCVCACVCVFMCVFIRWCVCQCTINLSDFWTSSVVVVHGHDLCLVRRFAYLLC